MKVIGYDRRPYDFEQNGIRYTGANYAITLEKDKYVDSCHEGINAYVVYVNCDKWSNVSTFTPHDLIGENVDLNYNKWGKISRIDIVD